MPNNKLNPLGPVKPLTAADINAGATEEGFTVSDTPEGDEVANRLFRKAEERPDAFQHGKYGALDLFEEGETVNGERTLRYKQGARRLYNNEAIKQNVLPYYMKQNPNAKIRFDYEYGGELNTTGVNPIAPIQ